MKVFKIIVALILLGSTASAGDIHGCYVSSSEKIYTAKKGNGKYKKGSGSIIGQACPAVSGPSCTVDNGEFGELGDFSILNCPLDTDVWVLILSSAAIGSFFIYRKQRLDTV